MNDTAKIMQDNFNSMLMRRTPEERLVMGCSMFDAAKSMVVSSLRNSLGELPQEFKKKLFLRFYGHEFDEAQKKKIFKVIS